MNLPHEHRGRHPGSRHLLRTRNGHQSFLVAFLTGLMFPGSVALPEAAQAPQHIGQDSGRASYLPESVADTAGMAIKEGPGSSTVPLLRDLKNKLPADTCRDTLMPEHLPLLLVDNCLFTGKLGDIDPASVRSIQVMDRASALSRYGAPAGNGVLMIRTRPSCWSRIRHIFSKKR